MSELLRNVKTLIEVDTNKQTYRLEVEGWSSIEGAKARIGAFFDEIEWELRES